MEADFYNKTISRNLRQIRKDRGLTTDDFAKILKVSQAKISYIENCKGILSARDIAIIAKHLDLPVTDFFKGLDRPGEHTEQERLASFLIQYGANELSNPAGLILKAPPFEEVIQQALGYIEDNRLHKAFCAALIVQAAKKDLNIDRIFALTGNNLFLVKQLAKIANLCLGVVENLNGKKVVIANRAKKQIRRILEIAQELSGNVALAYSFDEISDVASFVGKCLNAKK